MVMKKNPLIPAVMASLIGSVPAMKLEQLSFDCLSEVFTFIEVGQWHTLQILGEEVHPYFEIGLKLAAKRMFPGYPIHPRENWTIGTVISWLFSGFSEETVTNKQNSLVLKPGRAELISDDGPNPDLFPSLYTGEVIITDVLNPGETSFSFGQSMDDNLMVLLSDKQTRIVNLKTMDQREINKLDFSGIIVDDHTVCFKEWCNEDDIFLQIHSIKEDGSLNYITSIVLDFGDIQTVRKKKKSDDGNDDLELIRLKWVCIGKYKLHIYDALTLNEKTDTVQIISMPNEGYFTDDGRMRIYGDGLTCYHPRNSPARSARVIGFDTGNGKQIFDEQIIGDCLHLRRHSKTRHIVLDARKNGKLIMLDIHQNLRWKIPNSDKVHSIEWLSEDLFVAVSDDSYQVRSANQFGRLICECNRDSQLPNMPFDQPVLFEDIRFPKRGKFFTGSVYANPTRCSSCMIDRNDGFLYKLEFVKHDQFE